MSATEGTSGTAGTDTEPTTGEPFAGVIARVADIFLPQGGEPVEVARDPLEDFAKFEIVAGDAQTVYPGVYEGETRIEFADVPEDMYTMWLTYPQSEVLPTASPYRFGLVTAAREVMYLVHEYSGRPDVAMTEDTNTRISVSATGMEPLGPGDRFELYSYGADVYESMSPSFDPGDGSNSPALGDTELVGWVDAWDPGDTRGPGFPLVDPDQGDDLTLLHLHGRQLVEQPTGSQLSDAWSFARVETLRATAVMSLPKMIAGGITTMNGTFTPAPAKSLELDFRVSKFEAASYPAGSTTAMDCSIYAVLEPGVAAPVYGVTATFGSVFVESDYYPLDPACPPDACDLDVCASCDEQYLYPGDRVVSLEYANPFKHGTEVLSVGCRWYTFVTDPITLEQDYLSSSMWLSGRLSELQGKPLEPRLGAVRKVRINGMSLGADVLVNDVGTTPTISFEPPTLGTPDRYLVTIGALDDMMGVDGKLYRTRSVVGIGTSETSVTVPAGVLEPGGRYYVQITADRGRKLDAGTWYSHDIDTATAFAGRFSP